MGLYKRGKIWWYDFRYRGRRCQGSTSISNKGLATRIYHKTRTEVIEGKFFPDSVGGKRSFKDLMDRYEKEYISKKSSDALRVFKGYRKNLANFFSSYTISDITPKIINSYKTARLQTGVTGGTVNREFSCLRHAFNLAVKEWQWIRVNPCGAVSMEKENPPRDRWLNQEEENALLQVCPDWLRDIVVFMIHTGLRTAELLSLSWSNVDLFREVIIVKDGKRNGVRTVPLDTEAIKVLTEKSKVRVIDNDLLFCSGNRRSFNSFLGQVFSAALLNAGVEDFRLGDLRHTCATRWLHAGVDLYKVQLLLGHKKATMTQRYAHHSPETLREAIEKVESYYNIPTESIIKANN